MTKQVKQQHGLHYALVRKAVSECPSCGGKHGWHLHAACEGLRRRWGGCIVSHVDEQRGTRRCRLPHGWEVVHRVTRRGARYFHQYTGEGLYCEHHARELVASTNAPMHAQEVA
jgi:hypothetical protein